jgi:hypothetical protein
MTPHEFKKTAMRTGDTVWEVYDVRPFAERQGEALDCFLREIEMEIRNGRFSTSKPICVLHDRRLEILPTTLTWIKCLRALGVPLNFKQVD